jgi:4-alpha-glucanotransferase
MLDCAAHRFFSHAVLADRDLYEAFCRAAASWLDDFALFMALKQYHNFAVWSRWKPAIRWREPAALKAWRERLAEPIAVEKFQQFVFLGRGASCGNTATAAESA